MAEPNEASGVSGKATSQEDQGTSAPASEPAPKVPWSVAQVLAEKDLPAPAAPPATPLAFLHLLERLKTTPREGWRRFRAGRGESVADHMYRMGMLTFLMPPALRGKLDAARCTRMALVHDVAESLVGDITPADNIQKEEKHRREAEAVAWLTGRLLGLEAADGAAAGTGSGDAGGRADKWGMLAGGREILELWEDYEEGKSEEAKYLHDVDKIELLLQMVEYERHDECKVDLGEFVHVAERIVLTEMKELAAEILGERSELWQGHGKQAKNLNVGKAIKDKVEEDRRSQGT